MASTGRINRETVPPNGPFAQPLHSCGATTAAPKASALNENSPPGRVTQGVARDHVHAEQSQTVQAREDRLGPFAWEPWV